MAWWDTFRRDRPVVPPAITAAASIVPEPRSTLLKTPETWQEEAWNFYDTLGELNTAVTWLANMMSRVRIRAAMVEVGLDEPTITDTGIAAELIADLAGGVGGQSQLMRNFAMQLKIPGDCYLVGQQDGTGYDWQVRSTSEVRARSDHFETVVSRIPTITWAPLPEDSLVVRVWSPHPRFYHIADSPARSALPIMRELEMVNRHILAQYLSRLASAGILIMPSEVELPSRPEFGDDPDPFVSEWIEIAAEAIRTPGTASAVVPIPVRVPSDMADKFHHIDFTLKIDEKIIDKRESAINRLANKLDIPSETLTGRMADTNHWTAWQLDEAALKTHIAPLAETICYSLTQGYLRPRLKASQEDPAKWVVWYDLSELAVRPDKSSSAQEAYDRLELSGEALRRELGFDEADAPTDDEIREQGLKILLRTVPNDAVAALDELTKGIEIESVPAASPAPSGAVPAPTGPSPEAPAESGPPKTKENPPPPPGPEKAVAQARALHAIRIDLHGEQLIHPPLCADRAYSCPFTHASYGILAHPDTPGTYECRLDTFGRIMIGARTPLLDVTEWIRTMGRSNGHARA